ncbi:MAG: HAD family hydrolase [Oscillospiraceae bacterium]
MYKLAVFDMDGTILDTLEDLKDSVNYALSECGYPQRTYDEVRRFVGNGIRKLIERAVPEGMSVSDIDRVHEVFTGHYKVHCADKTKAYDGIKPLLEQLRANGVKTAVVSNKADYGVQELCKEYFDGLFDYAVGEREGIRRKPAPDSVNEALRVLGIPKSEAVYIGDSDVDYETAVNAGLPCISVLWGFRDEEFLRSKGASLFVHKPSEILSIVLGKAD